MPLAMFFPPLCSAFLLSSTLLVYLSTLYLLYSSGYIPFFTSSQQFMDPSQHIHLLYHFPPSLQLHPSTRGFYSTILMGSMRIKLFSTNNIFIESGISSNIYFLGPSANFLSASLKESMYSTTISII
jgi:hypothetical protein